MGGACGGRSTTRPARARAPWTRRGGDGWPRSRGTRGEPLRIRRGRVLHRERSRGRERARAANDGRCDRRDSELAAKVSQDPAAGMGTGRASPVAALSNARRERSGAQARLRRRSRGRRQRRTGHRALETRGGRGGRREAHGAGDAVTDELKVIEGGGQAHAVLKSLSLVGFKSFVHQTHLEFAPGITAIIGPNGSGKTNLVDAIRWALGENNARILRAKRNEELIFGGSETRKALGFAEALMQLDNSSRRLPISFEEVEVGRRLYRNGEAEYLVNRTRVRLRDMQDLLAGADLATKIGGVDKEIERLTDYVAEGESTTAGTDEDLRAARQEEERRRIASADAASTEASARERVAGLEASLDAIGAERERTGAALAALPAELASLRERRTRVDDE